MGQREVRGLYTFGVPLVTFSRADGRSEVFDDVLELFIRLGFRPKLRLHSMYLKDNGFWSCNWCIRISSRECQRLREMGLIIQGRKVSKIVNATR